MLFGIFSIYTMLLGCHAAVLYTTKGVSYVGRHVNNGTVAQFDWVATGFTIRLQPCNDTTINRYSATGKQAGNLTVSMSAGRSRFAVYLGNSRQFLTEFWTNSGQSLYSIADVAVILQQGGVLSVIKTTEPFSGPLHHPIPVTFYGYSLPTGVCAGEAPPALTKRIDLYGDSDSAGFGVDGEASHWLKCLEHLEEYENWNDGWVRRAVQSIAQGEDAVDVRVQAVSGIGVVRNAVNFGTPTFSTQTMPTVLKRNLYTVDKDDYDPSSWKPDVIILYIGSNDYIGSSVSKETFLQTYTAMTKNILAMYPAPKPPVLHICGGAEIPCSYIKEVSNYTGAYSTTFDFGIPTGGCVGHRNTTQQATLAHKIAPVIAKMAGWA